MNKMYIHIHIKEIYIIEMTKIYFHIFFNLRYLYKTVLCIS